MEFRRFLCALVLMLAVLPNLAAGEACPVTIPPNPPFVPPAPYQPIPSPRGFWYGTSALWTYLHGDGLWHGIREAGGYSNKLFLWTPGFDGRIEPRPDIIVVLRRLDAEAPLVSSRGGTNAFFDGSWAMLTGVTIPTAGCWEVTSAHGGQPLSFVVFVQP